MKLLVDANLSHRVAQILQENGYEAAHVRDLGLEDAGDPEIYDRADGDGYVIVTLDTDFARLAARNPDCGPSIILVRAIADLLPTEQVELIASAVDAVANDLASGAIVSLSPKRLAVRHLPIAQE